MRRETERWLRHAREDLETARVTLEGKRWSATSFHAQQAAEKALKALWLERRQTDVPRTHNLVRLAKELTVPDAWLADLDSLSRVYVMARYPGAISEDQEAAALAPETVEEHIRVAKRVVQWVEQQLSTASSGG